MKGLHHRLRQIILGAGYDLPQEPILPPMDLADGELRKLGVQVSRLAVALGREADVQTYASTVPAVRSLSEIRQAVGGLLLVSAGLATQLGIDPETLLAEAVKQPHAARTLL